jgi:hypothetical protein
MHAGIVINTLRSRMWLEQMRAPRSIDIARDVASKPT